MFGTHFITRKASSRVYWIVLAEGNNLIFINFYKIFYFIFVRVLGSNKDQRMIEQRRDDPTRQGLSWSLGVSKVIIIQYLLLRLMLHCNQILKLKYQNSIPRKIMQSVERESESVVTAYSISCNET